MTTAAEFIHTGMKQLHKALDKTLAELTPEQLHTVPAGHAKANTIAWILWHVVRTEDNVVRFVLQNRRPTVWQEGGYAEKLGLPPVAQGTGMPTAEAQALRLTDVALFREYTQKVWTSTDEFLARTSAEQLEATVTVKPFGELRAVQALGQICLTHAMAHAGEIDVSRTLLGLGTAYGA
jgi:hypothetical protein